MTTISQYMFVCCQCGSDKTYTLKSGKSQWRLKYGNRYCKKCWNELFDYEGIRKGKKKYSNKIIRFKGKQIALFKMRSGICSQCGITRKTNIHHEIYIIIFPWFSTQELCVPCHNKKRIGTHYDKVLVA
jgi:hypothetical protein